MKYLIVHHLPEHDQESPNIESIIRYHKEVKGWPDIWYHKVVASRKTYYTRSWEPTHDRGNGNESIDIALSGNGSEVEPTDYQKSEIRYYAVLFGVDRVIGHSQASEMGLYSSETACPGSNYLSALKKLNMDKIRIKVDYKDTDPFIEPEAFSGFLRRTSELFEFVTEGKYHILLRCREDIYKSYKGARMGSAKNKEQYAKNPTWHALITKGTWGHTYEELLMHEIISHVCWFWVGLGDWHQDPDSNQGMDVEQNNKAFEKLIATMQKPLIDYFTLIGRIMYGRLVKGHPDQSKVYFVRGGNRHHINNPDLLTTVWNWGDVSTISKTKWDELVEGEPIGFVGETGLARILKSLFSR